jgi:hypothetical protein
MHVATRRSSSPLSFDTVHSRVKWVSTMLPIKEHTTQRLLVSLGEQSVPARMKLSSQGCAVLMREPSVVHCFRQMCASNLVLRRLQGVSINPLYQLGNRKSHCYKKFKRRTQNTPCQSFFVGSAIGGGDREKCRKTVEEMR